jgi:hypothetical protein
MAEVGKSAAQRAGDVTGVVGEQAKQTVSEAGAQAKNLLDEGVHQLRGQARDGQQKLARGLRGVTDQLRKMSDQTDDSGMAADLVRQATERTDQVASWLESREPGDLVDEARRFARQHPGTFLAGAALLGVLAGRLTRNVVASARDDGPAGQRDSARLADQPGAFTPQPSPTPRPMTSPVTAALPAPQPGGIAPAAPGVGSYPTGGVGEPRPAVPSGVPGTGPVR